MPHNVFPWRQGNRFALLLDGERFFPRMLELIAGAQRQVALELYLVESGACAAALLDALCAAAQRGVAVRCLFDAFGAQGLHQAERRRLLEAGVQLHWYNPVRWKQGLRNFHRDHRKLLLIDQGSAFVGGTGVTDEFWTPGNDTADWHEVMVQIQGPVVSDWQLLFDRQWHANDRRTAWRPPAAPRTDRA
mgnify:CR=1 FL=1